MASRTENPGKDDSRSSEQRRKRAAELRDAQLKGDRRRKTNAILVAVVGALLVAGLIAVAVVTQKKSTTGAAAEVIPSRPTGAVITQKAAVTAQNSSGIDGVLAWDTGNYPGAKKSATQLENNHAEGPTTYTVTPPVGGPHSATWLNAGVYTKPVPSEFALHDLEHGAVWFNYRPALANSQVSALRALIAKQTLIPESEQATRIPGAANRYVGMSPWVDNSLPSPIVISAWGHQLRVDSASDPRLQKFIDLFRNSKTYTPEFGSPVDGVPIEVGGRAAYSGGAKADPKGGIG